MNFVPRKCLNGEHACRVIVGRLIFELDVEQRPPLLSFSSFFFFSTRKRNEERDHRGSRTTRFSNNTIGTLVADDPTESIRNNLNDIRFRSPNIQRVAPFLLSFLSRWTAAGNKVGSNFKIGACYQACYRVQRSILFALRREGWKTRKPSFLPFLFPSGQRSLSPVQHPEHPDVIPHSSRCRRG